MLRVGNRNLECYLTHVNFHLNKQSLLWYCCYWIFMESQTGSGCPGKYKILEKSLGKTGNAEQWLACYLGKINERCGSQGPFRMKKAGCPHSPVWPILLFTIPQFHDVLKTGGYLPVTSVRGVGASIISVTRLDSSVYCRHCFEYRFLFFLRLSVFFLYCKYISCLEKIRFYILEIYIQFTFC